MDIRQSISNQSDHSFFLAHHAISAYAHHSNLLISPLSIHVLLGMLAAGSKGPTGAEILRFLMSTSSDALNAFFSQISRAVLVDGSPLGGPVLSTANGVWVDLSLNLNPSYRDLLHNCYRAVSERLDFQNKPGEVTELVNSWGSKETNGLIKDILPPGAVDPRITRVILANAVYFKGSWTRKFDASLTKEHDFYLLNGSSVRAPLMSSRKAQYFRAFDGFKVVRLPYEPGKDGRRFSMYIYLPDAKDGLPSLRERMCSQSGFIDTHLPSSLEIFDKFLIPKFKFEMSFEASALLQRLGIVHLFQGGELNEMVDSRYPIVGTKIYHKSFIEVNEEGTEAAAVSVAAVAFGSCALPPLEMPRLEFVADHPFMFVLREDTTGVVLFIGQLLNPLASR